MRSGFGDVSLDCGASKFRRWEGWCAMLEGCWKGEDGNWKVKNFGFGFGLVLFCFEREREKCLL